MIRMITSSQSHLLNHHRRPIEAMVWHLQTVCDRFAIARSTRGWNCSTLIGEYGELRSDATGSLFGCCAIQMLHD
jgi:hypothetical protein